MQLPEDGSGFDRRNVTYVSAYQATGSVLHNIDKINELHKGLGKVFRVEGDISLRGRNVAVVVMGQMLKGDPMFY